MNQLNNVQHISVGGNSSKVNAKPMADSKNVNLPEYKRAQSVKQMIKAYQHQKQVIQTALNNLDAKWNNKIVFDEDHDSESESHNGSIKRNLFQIDDEEEEEELNFEVKSQFDGDKGQKLFNLQSKFKGDRRFALNERFIENDEAVTEQQTVTPCEFTLQDEKRNEINILEKVLERKIKSVHTSTQPILSLEKKMLRYDPTQSEHLQYQITVNSKHKKLNRASTNEPNKSEESDQPLVSKDVFYKVSNNLKSTLQTKEGFSLLNLFGEGEDNRQNDQETKESFILKHKTLLELDNNPFKYDSSDDELVVNDDEINKHDGNKVDTADFLTESFFFKEDDFHLQEGSDFVKRIASESNPEFVQQRQNLKYLIKNKVGNSNRKKNPFKKKLRGNNKKKVLRIKKALKR